MRASEISWLASRTYGARSRRLPPPIPHTRPLAQAKEFVASLERPRRVIFLVKAGAPVDATVELFADLLEVRARATLEPCGAR